MIDNNFELETLVLGALQTNCYIIYNNKTKEAMVIDPANDVEKIIKYLEERDLVCKAVLLTHGHFDHIMAVSELKDATGAVVYAHEDERELLESPVLNASSQVGRNCVVKPDVFLHEGHKLDLIGFSLEVVHTPGHTAGGVCYLFKDQKVLISGDTLFRDSIGRSDLPTGNGQVLVDSIRTKLMVLDEDVNVYPGHGMPTTIGHEKNHNPFVRA